MHSIFSAAAFVLGLIGYVLYIPPIVRGPSRPSKATWLIWATLDMILGAGMLRAGTLNGQMLGVCLGASAIALLSLKFGTPGWTRIDRLCGLGAAMSLGAWVATGTPLVGMLACLAVIVLGAIPTFLSAWEKPERENFPAWIVFEAVCVSSILAIPGWTLAAAAQPVVFLAITTVMLATLTCRRRVRSPE